MTDLVMCTGDFWTYSSFEFRSIALGMLEPKCCITYSSLFLDACYFTNKPRFSVLLGYKRPFIDLEGYPVSTFKCYD